MRFFRKKPSPLDEIRSAVREIDPQLGDQSSQDALAALLTKIKAQDNPLFFFDEAYIVVPPYTPLEALLTFDRLRYHVEAETPSDNSDLATILRAVMDSAPILPDTAKKDIAEALELAEGPGFSHLKATWKNTSALLNPKGEAECTRRVFIHDLADLMSRQLTGAERVAYRAALNPVAVPVAPKKQPPSAQWQLLNKMFHLRS